MLLGAMSLKEAAELSGLKTSYLSDSRSKRCRPAESHLCTDLYPTKTKRQKINPIEVKCHREWMREELGQKSGQATADDYYLYGSKDSIYHEKYQTRGLSFLLSHCLITFIFLSGSNKCGPKLSRNLRTNNPTNTSAKTVQSLETKESLLEQHSRVFTRWCEFKRVHSKRLNY